MGQSLSEGQGMIDFSKIDSLPFEGIVPPDILSEARKNLKGKLNTEEHQKWKLFCKSSEYLWKKFESGEYDSDEEEPYWIALDAVSDDFPIQARIELIEIYARGLHEKDVEAGT